MNRIQKLTCLLALLGLLATAGAAQAQIVTAGELFVDLTADDFDTQSQISVWTNHGTLPDFVKWDYDLNDPGVDDDETSNVVGQYDITRGVQIRTDDDGFVLPATGLLGDEPTSAPAGLIGNSDWSVEVWLWELPQGGEECVVGIGQRNGPNESQAQLCVGSIAFVGWGEDWGWGANTPTNSRWHHVVWTHSGDSNYPTDDPSNGSDGTLLVYVDGALAVTANFFQPLDIGDLSGNTFVGGKRLHALTVGGTLAGDNPNNAGWADGNNAECGIGRVRIHDGVLTSASVLNNYNFEKDEFIPKPAPPQPRVGWRSPTSGRVLEFGEVDSPSTNTRLVHIKNTGTATLPVLANTISGPDAARYSIQTIPLPPPAVGDYPTTGTLAPNAEVRYNVVFTPTSTAETTAALSIDFGTTLGLGRITLRGNVERIYVATAPTGSDSFGNGTFAAPFASLNRAFQVMEPGDVIEMGAGIYGPSSVPDFPDGSRSVRVVGNGQASLFVPQSDTVTGFDLQSNQIPNPNIPPPPPGLVFPLPDPLAQVYDWNDSTLSFENITLDAASNSFNSFDEPLRLNGSGTFDVTFINSKLLNNWGTAALQGDLNGPDDRLTGGVSPIIRVTALNSTFRGDGPDQDHDSVRLLAQLVEATFTNCDLRSGGGANLWVASTVHPGVIALNSCQLGTLSPGDTTRWTSQCVQVNPGPASAAGTQVTLTNCTLKDWTDAGIASFAVASSINATGCIFSGGVGAGTNRPDWGVFYSDAGTYPNRKNYFTDCIFTGPVQRHITAIEGQDLRVTNSLLSGQRGAAIQMNTSASNQPTTFSVIGCTLDTGTTTGVNSNPAGVHIPDDLNNSGFSPMFTIVQRNTIRSLYTGEGTTPSLIQRGSGVLINRSRSTTIAGNLIEGSDFPVYFTNAAAPQNAPLIINNTIVGLSTDSDSSIAVRSTLTTLVPQIRNNVVLGYPTLTNVTAPLVSSQFVAGEPAFIAPYPFAAPAAAGMSDYHLRGISPLIDAVTTTNSVAQLDRDGNDREANAPWDIGAYEFQAGANPVGYWTWY